MHPLLMFVSEGLQISKKKVISCHLPYLALFGWLQVYLEILRDALSGVPTVLQQDVMACQIERKSVWVQDSHWKA